MSWAVARRAGAAVLLVLAGAGLAGDIGPDGPDGGPAGPPGGGAAPPDGAIDPPSTPDPVPLPPVIEVSPHARGCRSTSLTGRPPTVPAYPVVTQSGSTVAVDWSVDGRDLGTAIEAPFVPRDAAGAPVPLPPSAFAPGPHRVTARLRGPDGTAHELAAAYVTGTATAGPIDITVTPAGAAAGPTRAEPAPLGDWALLHGVVAFGASGSAGGEAVLDLDGRPAPPTVDAGALPPGRHTLTARAPAPGGATASATRTFVTTGGRPRPEPCGPVDVRAYGAAGDGRADDSAAVAAATDVAMAAGATVHLPAGTYAVPTLAGVSLPRAVAFVGAPGAVLDARRPRERYDVFRVNANVSFSGLAVRDAGTLFSFDDLAHRVDRFVVERSSFRDVYAPAHASDAPPALVELVELAENDVERTVKGFYLPLTAIGHARVHGNVLTDVGDAAVRLGSDRATSFASQRDIDVRGNTIRRVTGPSDANGVKVLGVGGVIVGNVIEDVASEDGTDAEGIYTKGHGHLIAGNRLRDAGRTQAQIAVKSDRTVVAGNVIVTQRARTNGLRIEGSDVVVSGNHLRGGLAGSAGISTKLTRGFGEHVVEGNRFDDTDGIGISIGGDGPIAVRANTFRDVRGDSAVAVRATRADTRGVRISGNDVGPMPGAGARALHLEARRGRTLSEVRVQGNVVSDVAFGVVFDVGAGAAIRDVSAGGNMWHVDRAAYRGEERVDGFRPG